MKQWAFLGTLVAAMALVGCGGGGDNGGGGGGGGGGTTDASVNTSLFYSGATPKPGYLEVTYNTGQGRGTNPITATLRRLIFEDSAFGTGDSRNLVRTLLNPERVLQLDGYTSQSVGVNTPMNGFSTNLNDRKFTDFNLEIQSVTLNGNTYTGAGGQSVINSTFPLEITTMPGRTTSLQVFINDAMVEEDGLGGLNLLTQEFEDVNLDQSTGTMRGFLADYLAFDISGVPNPPLMTNGDTATTIYFSGDAIALSDTPLNAPTSFEVLVPETPDPGSVEGFCQLAPSFPPNSPNTYTLRQIDPRSLPNTSHITALQGTWKWWLNTDVPTQSPILNPGNFVFITFPQSEDGSTQDCALLSLSGNSITEFYFGEVNLTSNTFTAWPLSEVTAGTTNGEISGTLGSYIVRPGVGFTGPRDIRGGSFNLTTGTIPTQFPATGKFIVYRL